MADFLDEKRREIAARLGELKPLVEEYHRLEAAAAALAGVGSRAAGTARRGAGRAKTTAKRARGTARRGRPPGTGQRAKQTLELVKATPGITIPELADAMGIKQNYLYRVMPTLQKDGLVKKQGKGWHPKT